MPQILLKLIDLCQREDVGMVQLAKLISHDAGMATKILNVANSSAYNCSGHKVSLAQALNTLGTEMIKTLVISESVFHTFNSFSRAGSTDLHTFWLHSLKTAVLARELAKKIAYPHSEEAYLAGLLHDVGRLALLSASPHEYGSNFMAQDDDRLCAVERLSLGLTHPEAGAWLIEHWNLDSFLADSVRYHHEPVSRLQSAHPLIRIVSLAHLLSSRQSDSAELEEAGALCGIDQLALQAILTGAAAQIKTAAAYFEIDLSNIAQPLQSAEYDPLEPAVERYEVKLNEEVRNMALVSTAGQAFSRMGKDSELIASIARTSRILFSLEDVIVLLHHNNTQVLVGFPISEYQQRLAGFSIQLTGAGVVAESVFKRRVIQIDRNNTAIGLADEQLLRMMGAECLAYLPMMAGPICKGVLVFGMSAFQADELRERERFLLSFATQAAVALESFTAVRGEIDQHIADAVEAHRDVSRRVVHEVNNPLAIIKNYLGVLDDKLASNEPVAEELSILNEEIDRVSRIVGSLSALPPAGREETAEVNGILNDVVRLFSISRFLPSSVNIVVRETDQPAEMLGAADTLRQIILNLLKNAIEALPRGGNIEIKNNGRTLRQGRTYIDLCISDNGTGIPAEVMPRLFSPVQSSKRGENRGLGLSIVQELVTELNGFISCRSAETGTTFEILLPASGGDVSSATLRVASAR